MSDLRLPNLPRYSGEDIRRIRLATRLSRPMFAACLNTSWRTLAAWEQGAKAPSAMALKLLNIVERRGLGALL